MIGTIEEGARLGGGRYVLQSRLGTGGAATVWLGDDSVLERPVAIKILSEGLASDETWLVRFTREARMAAGLSHPNLVSVYDFDAGGERPYIVMAYMPGGSLWDRMQTGEPSDPERLARDLLTALEVIHGAGIVHRDIKPGNVLFDRGGAACLTDFGVARPEDATSLTQTGQIPGTAQFMAPELWEGRPADERSDLYAAGVVLSEAIGYDASPEVHALIKRLTSKDARDRPASASVALRELDESPSSPPATQADGLTEEPTQRAFTIQADRRSHRGAAIAGLALLAVVAGFAIAQAIGGGDDGAPNGRATTASTESKPEKPSRDKGSGQSGSGETADAEPTSAPVATDPLALNDEGKTLLDGGDPESAIPLLQQAVDSYPENSSDINYAYALYNLGDALVQAGRPEDAIPYLEKRLTFNNQTETVQAKLDEAYAAAGEGPPSDSGKPPKEPKAPPGQEKKEG